LKAKFVLDGKAPTPEKANVNKDIEVCGKHKLVDETFKINAQTGAIQNVAVFLSPKPGAAKPKIHPVYEKADANVVLDNHNCHFEPHIVIVRTTQKLVVNRLRWPQHKADFFVNTPQRPDPGRRQYASLKGRRRVHAPFVQHPPLDGARFCP
jgi:hypothetical protein